MQACNPCGSKINVCDNATRVTPLVLNMFKKSNEPFNCADHAPYLWSATDASVDSSSNALFVNADGEILYLLKGVLYNVDACNACGAGLDVCLQSINITSIQLGLFIKSSVPFSCKVHASKLWRPLDFKINASTSKLFVSVLDDIFYLLEGITYYVQACNPCGSKIYYFSEIRCTIQQCRSCTVLVASRQCYS